jgi:hypothetical protein
MEIKYEKRAFKRFQVEFEADITARDLKAEIFQDRVMLKNISGEGANFITQQSQRYYIGQLLNLVIYMPGNRDVQACMKVTATVLRMDSDSPKTGGSDHEMSIALKLEAPLHFERLDLT